MKFNNEHELQETYQIINDLWSGYWTIYSPIKMDITNYTISFTADSYFDPVLTILKLKSKNIISATFEYGGSEKDKITITGCNLNLLRKLSAIKPFPDYNKIASVLNDLLSSEEIEVAKQTSEPKFIILASAESGDQHVPIKDWKEYWHRKGKDGPSSGWDIPTFKQLYETLNS